MASTYENDLRLEEMATGENSGSWGTKTNTNLELIADAFSYGTETIADADTTLTIADGAADAARSLALKINSSVDLTTTRTVTLAPNTTSKVWIIENNTSGGQTLTISAGSGSNITLANGTTKIIATDGIGAGSNVVELTQDIAIADLSVDGILSLADGTNSAPSLTNTGDTNTGLYFPAADEVGITVGGTQVFKADSTGANVTGTLVSDGLTVDGGATINEKLTINKQGEALTLRSGGSSTQNYVSIGRTSEDARLTMAGVANNGVNSSSAGDLVIGVNNGLVVGRQGSPYLNINSTELVINQNGSNIDFRVESDNSSSMLFVDAGNDRIGINYSTPATIMHIRGGDPDLTIEATSTSGTTLGDKNSRIMLRGNSTTAGNGSEIVWATADDANRRWAVISGHIEGNTGSSASGGLVFGTKGTSDSALNNRLQIKAGSEAVFNEDSTNFDFRVESDSRPHMLFVDAENDYVGINQSSPAATLDVQDNVQNANGTLRVYQNTATNNPTVKILQRGEGGSQNTNQGLLIDIAGHNDGNGYILNTSVTNSNINGGVAFSPFSVRNIGTFQFRHGGVINENGVDSDFRVESDSNTHALFVDANSSKVALGFNSPQAAFSVQHSLNNSSDWWTNTKGSAYLQNLTGHTVIKFNNETGWDGKIVYNSSTSTGFSLFDRTSLQTSFQVYSNAIVLNEDSADRDFRVESDSNDHMLFVDAGQNRVGVGTNAPATTFNVVGQARITGPIDSESTGTGYGAPGINATITGLPCYEGVVYQYIARANTSPTNVAIQTGYAMGRTGSTFTFQQTLSSSRIGVTSAANGDITITNTHSGSAALSIRVLRIL